MQVTNVVTNSVSQFRKNDTVGLISLWSKEMVMEKEQVGNTFLHYYWNSSEKNLVVNILLPHSLLTSNSFKQRAELQFEV